MGKTLKKITDEELQSAWDVVSEYMNQHQELSFFIDPWSGKDGMLRKYNLHYINENEKYVEVVRSSSSWKK